MIIGKNEECIRVRLVVMQRVQMLPPPAPKETAIASNLPHYIQ